VRRIFSFGKYLVSYARNAGRQNYEGLQVKYLFLGAFAQSLKGLISFVMSVRLSVYTSAAPPRRIFVKFDIGAFYENLPRKSKFGQNRTILSNTLNEDQSTFYCHRRHKFALRAPLCNTQNVCSVDSDK
jgi:hypothetical protein